MTNFTNLVKIKKNYNFVLVFNGHFTPLIGKLDLFNEIKNFSDYYFKIIRKEKFEKIINLHFKNLIKKIDFHKKFLKEIFDDIDDLKINKNKISQYRQNQTKIIKEKIGFNKNNWNSKINELIEKNSKVTKIFKLYNDLYSKISKITLELVEYKKEIFNNIYNLKGLEKRLLRLMIIRDIKFIKDLNKNDIESYLKRKKSFVFQNINIKEVEIQKDFIDKSWTEKSSLNI